MVYDDFPIFSQGNRQEADGEPDAVQLAIRRAAYVGYDAKLVRAIRLKQRARLQEVSTEAHAMNGRKTLFANGLDVFGRGIPL